MGIPLKIIYLYGIICLVVITLYTIVAIKLKLKERKYREQLGKRVNEEEHKQKKVWSFWGKI